MRTFLSLLLLLAFFAAIETDAFSLHMSSSPTTKPNGGLTYSHIQRMAQKRFNNISSTPMKDKVIVITGSAGGIGSELSTVIYNLGGTVIALDRDQQGLQKLQQKLESNESNTGRFIPMIARHEDLNSVSNVAEEILTKFPKVDVLINNAGLTYRDTSLLSSHGNDLSFTVNYLSHFLLTEKLAKALSNAYGRIVHITSTYHWKVNGSELIPINGRGPMAYEGQKEYQSNKHVERAYGNSKLAQIWHCRTTDIENVNSVCACPTWASTGIGGEDARDFLQKYAFPVADCGPGITSALNAILKTDGELKDALNDGDSFVANSRILEYILGRNTILAGDFVTNVLGWRDTITDVAGMVLLFGQKRTYSDFIIQKTSPQSNDVGKMKALREWSLKEVAQWL